MNYWNQWKYFQNFLLLIFTPTRSCREICREIMNKNSNNFLKIRNCPNCVPSLVWRLLKKGTILHYIWWRRRTRWNEESVSRAHVISKRRSIFCESVDSQKHENLFGLGCEGLFLFVKEIGWTSIQTGSVKIVLQCRKAMIRLLRHDPSILREDDGAVRFDDIVEKSRQSSMVFRNG